jgi:hypothetical protein
MAIINFNSQALSAHSQTPSNLSWSISSGYGLSATVYIPTVVLLSTSTTVRGIAFNALTTPTSGTGLYVNISAAPGTLVRVDRAYNGSTMAVINTDDTSSLFTVATGVSAMPTLVSNEYDSSYPETKRLFTLGYI